MKKLDARARTTEVDDTSDRLLILFSKQSTLAEETFLKPLFGKIRTASDQITEAIKRDRTVSDLDDADSAVEEVFRALGAVINGYYAMPLEKYSTAAQVLHIIKSKYTSEILKLSYANQSANIESMLMDLSAPELKASIDALPGVSETIAKLRAAQTDFTAKRIAYEKAVTANTATPSASRLKKPLLHLINAQLVPYLSTMQMVNADTYKSFADAVAQTIESTNAAIRRRNKKKEDKPETLSEETAS